MSKSILLNIMFLPPMGSSTPTRPVENVITTKGQKQQLLDGRTVENKDKLILRE